VKGDHRSQSGRWVIELRTTLATAAELAERGRTAYNTDPALRLAFEALSNRVGDLAKRLVALDPERFAAPIWSAAARNRDVVAHHYHRIDHDLLWQTVAHDFIALRSLLDEISPELSPPPAR
jgi:uncharacterized protein with HEPN domain